MTMRTLTHAASGLLLVVLASCNTAPTDKQIEDSYARSIARLEESRRAQLKDCQSDECRQRVEAWYQDEYSALSRSRQASLDKQWEDARRRGSR